MSDNKATWTMLNDVRLSFENLFQPYRGTDAKPDDAGKYSASFILGPDHPAVKVIQAGIVGAAKDKWGAKASQVLKELKAGDRLCLHDGDAKARYPGYAGNLFINASNKARPIALNKDKSPLAASDGVLYSGCYVNARVEFWAMDNAWGRRVNASLGGVQFVKDGERLSGGGVAGEDDFDEIPTDEAGAADPFAETPPATTAEPVAQEESIW